MIASQDLALLVEHAVVRAGRAAATFDTGDVQAELAVLLPAKRISASSVRRHLTALVGTRVYRVSTGVVVVAEPEELQGATLREPPARFRLRGTRAPADPYHVLDDTARVLLALYIACGVAGAPAVPTRLTTRVLAAEPALTLHSSQQTATILARLATLYPALVHVGRGRGRTQLWGAAGVLRPEWCLWVEARAAALDVELARYGGLAETGAASAADAAARLVELVEARVADTHWPAGRPDSARRITHEVALARAESVPTRETEALVHLADLVVRRDGDLSEAPQSACRKSFSHGGRRRQLSVRRVRPVGESSTCYASAALAPHVVDTWVTWRAAQMACSREALARLERERTFTAGLQRVGDPLLSAIAAVRVVLAVEEIRRMRDGLEALRSSSQRISASLEEARRRLHVQVESTAQDWPSLPAAEAAARDALQVVGLTLAAMRRGPRPTISIATFAGLIPAVVRRGLSDGVLAATAVTVRKVEVTGGRSSRVGLGRTPRYPLDRPDALLHAAENAGLPGRSMLLAGSRLIGPWMGDPTLARHAAGHEDVEIRAAGIGALILLGETGVVARQCKSQGRANALPEQERSALMAAWWWIEALKGAA